MDIDDYVAQFRDLRPNRANGRARPHKACLLLAVIDMMDSGKITENRIEFGSALKDAFSQRFERYRRGNDQDDPSQPFFYLTSSSFWHLEPRENGKDELDERLKERRHGGPSVVSRLIKYAYLDKSLYEFLCEPVYRAMLAVQLETTLMSVEESFDVWCKSIGISETTTASYAVELKDVFVEGIDDSAAISGVLDEDEPQGAKRLYSRFVRELYDSDIEKDILKLENRDIDVTVRQTLVSARRGQGVFRARVLAQCKNQCAVTGYGDSRFLVASHIKPWRASSDRERLDRFNGFSLIPSLDRAFDIGFISFDETGNIKISPRLEEAKKLGVSDLQRVELSREHQDYLAYHRSKIFADC